MPPSGFIVLFLFLPLAVVGLPVNNWRDSASPPTDAAVAARTDNLGQSIVNGIERVKRGFGSYLVNENVREQRNIIFLANAATWTVLMILAILYMIFAIGGYAAFWYFVARPLKEKRMRHQQHRLNRPPSKSMPPATPTNIKASNDVAEQTAQPQMPVAPPTENNAPAPMASEEQKVQTKESLQPAMEMPKVEGPEEWPTSTARQTPVVEEVIVSARDKETQKDPSAAESRS